jgi:antitoxin component YwqK of YwqJK toxin-antitoxin module
MKKLLILLLISFCFSDTFSQSYELFKGDTINKTDANRRRQGYWRVKAEPMKHQGYQPGSLVEEGKYQNSRKEGIWKKYYPSGKLKSEITYEGSRPKGPYILYYENGEVEEQSNWERTKNVGDFKRYHQNGEVAQDFTFTEEGKRNGEQKYYYENGQLRLVGTWQDGQENGEMREYYENGDLMSVKYFNNGEMDKDRYESYAPKTPQEDALTKQINEGKEMNVTATRDEKPNMGKFDGNGYKKLYNRDRQIAKDGTFKNYRLMDGKQYKYDDNGLLMQILIFKDGKYIGDGVIEDSES